MNSHLRKSRVNVQSWDSLYSSNLRRKRTRLPDYDYSSGGAYFVTICTHNRKNFFGEIASNEMRCNDSGCMVAKYWSELENKFPGIELAEHVVMPNHFHGIIIITEDVGAALH